MEEERYITVTLGGRRGAGKSTLLKNLVSQGLEGGTSYTSVVDIKKDGNTFNFIDSTSQKELKKGLDVLIYCMPICPGFKFQDGNPEAMQSLQNTYGADIWKHCIIVFTFGNLAWDNVNSRRNNPEQTKAAFKKYLDEYLELFRTELETKLNVRKAVRLMETGLHTQPQDQHLILAIPAGDTPKDQLLAGVTSQGECWTDKLFQAVLLKSSCITEKIKPLPNHTTTFEVDAHFAMAAHFVTATHFITRTILGKVPLKFLLGLTILAGVWWFVHSL